MNKIKKISSYLLFALNIMLIAVPLFILSTWYFIDAYTMTEFSSTLLQNSFQIQDGMATSIIDWTLYAKMIGLIGHIINLLPLYLSVFVLKSIFKNYKNGEIFSTTNAIHYKHIGWLCFCDALLADPIGDAIMIMSTTLSPTIAKYNIDIVYNYPSIEGLFSGAVFIVISLVMFEASKLQEESKFTV